MRLELGIIKIKDVQFGDETTIEDGTLYVNKKELIALALQDDRLSEADVELARPGEEVALAIQQLVDVACLVHVHVATRDELLEPLDADGQLLHAEAMSSHAFKRIGCPGERGGRCRGPGGVRWIWHL